MSTNTTLDVGRIRKDFPILERQINGRRIVYLDSSATSQKPRQVIEAMTHYYEYSNANVHRSVFEIAAEATEAYESARHKIRRFINAADDNEVVFTKNATESINLVAHSWARSNLKAGDIVLLTMLEHHSNIVPWQMVAAERGIQLRWVPLTPEGHLDLDQLPQLLDGAKVFAFSAMSNVLGTITPVHELCRAARAAGATTVVDACQFVPHNVTDVQAMGADFIAFSGHKMCGPTGIGVLWGRYDLLEAMPPFLGGGSMISDVRLDGFAPAEVPVRFEAGTPPIAEAVGLGAAVDYLNELGMTNVRSHEMALTTYALRTLEDRFGDTLTLFGPRNVETRGGVISFALKGVHPHDVSQVLDQTNVCVRAGHHCAKPLMRLLGVNATARASLYVYNDESDVDALADGLANTTDFFSL